MFNKTTKKVALSLAFGAASLISANANAGFYAGLGFDMGFTVDNPDSPEFNSVVGNALRGWTAFDNKMTLGFDIRVGYEAVVLSRMYLAGEAYGRFMFDVSGHGRKDADQPYISGGLAAKIGATFNEGKTKGYALVASEYMAGGIMLDKSLVGITVHQVGLILVGAGLGMKQEILPFMDVFLEFKVMFDVFSHFNVSAVNDDYTLIPSTNGDGTLGATATSSVHEQTGSIGYQLMNVSVGADFKF